MRRDPRRPDLHAVGIAAGLLLGCMLLLPEVGSARDKPTSFERAYETAKKLHELYERLEDAETLFMLDSIDRAIVGGGCRREHLLYSEALAEVQKLAARIRARESLTSDEADYYKDQRQAEARLWKEFEDCYDEQLRQPTFRNELPPGIDTYLDVVTTYEYRREEHGWQQDDGFDAVAAEIELEIEKLESEPADIATVTRVLRQVELVRDGRPRRLRERDKIRLRDTVRTGPRALAVIELHDRIEEKNAGPTVLTIGPNSEAEMEKYGFLFEDEEEAGLADHLVDFVRGRMRAFTRSMHGIFSVRPGTTVVGIRGTDIQIDYLPELREVTLTLREGEVEVTTPGGKVVLEPGRVLTVRDGVPGPVRPIVEQEAEGPPT